METVQRELADSCAVRAGNQADNELSNKRWCCGDAGVLLIVYRTGPVAACYASMSPLYTQLDTCFWHVPLTTCTCPGSEICRRSGAHSAEVFFYAAWEPVVGKRSAGPCRGSPGAATCVLSPEV